MTSPARPAETKRTLPLGLFGVTLGLAGLGGGWAAASQLLRAPRWPQEVMYASGAGLWIVFTAIYVAQSLRQTQKIRTDIENPISGPFIAFIPVVAVLLAQHYSQYAPIAGTYVILFFVTILAAIAARLAAHWISGGLPSASVMHGGYLVPVVAGPFIASIGLTSVGLHDLALYAFGAGLFFWLTIGTIVMYSHIAGGRVQPSASPALTAFLAASATAAIAWLVAHPGSGPLDALQSILTGVLFIMLFVQIALIRQYRRLPFGMEYWVFTFPVASTSNYLIRWLAQVNTPGWQVWAWGVLALSTAFVVVIGIGTVVVPIRGRKSKSAELAGRLGQRELRRDHR